MEFRSLVKIGILCVVLYFVLSCAQRLSQSIVEREVLYVPGGYSPKMERIILGGSGEEFVLEGLLGGTVLRTSWPGVRTWSSKERWLAVVVPWVSNFRV